MTANADGLRQRLSTYAGNLVNQAVPILVEHMRTEAPIAPAGGPDLGGSTSRGELRRSLMAGPTQFGLDRSVGTFLAPVVQAATTDLGAAPHVIRATQPHGRLAFFSRRAGKVIIFGSPKHPAVVNHPGNAAQHWSLFGFQRWWGPSLAESSHQVVF